MPEYQMCEEILYHENVSGNDYDEEEWTEWLQWEKERACYGMQVTPEAVEKVKELIPSGYRLKFETDIAVCDLNHDGTDDYVVSIYDPVTMSKEEIYYAAEDMWMFLSDGNGGYKKKRLMEDKLYCADLRFVADGALVCENLIGMNHYGEPMRYDYFFYDDATERFYLDKVFQSRFGEVLAENRTTLENLTVDEYYSSGASENVSSGWAAIFSYYVYPEDGRRVEFASDVIYRNADKDMEKTINDKIFEIELAATESLLREFDEDIRIKSCLNYLNSRIYVGCIEEIIWREGGYIQYNLPVIIDLKNGEFLDITDLIFKEDFIGICQKGMKDRYRNELSKEDKERGINLIKKKYEDALRVTSSGELILATEDTWICLEITSWGVRVTGKDDIGDIQFMLDKEYFIDSPLWHYMEPDFR